jgi:hypothetical protein
MWDETSQTYDVVVVPLDNSNYYAAADTVNTQLEVKRLQIASATVFNTSAINLANTYDFLVNPSE